MLPHFGPFQLGGRPRGQVAFCTQAVRAFLNVAKHQRRPAAVLFIDVKQAFYSLPRHHAVGPFLSGEEYAWLVRQLQASPGTQDKCQGACDAAIPAALREVPPHLMRLLRSLVRHGWLADQHDDACAFTLTGTRPGLPLADLLFNVAMVDVLTQLQGDLANHGIVSSLFSEQPETFPLVAWQDDVALAFDGADNAELRARMDLVVLQWLRSCGGDFAEIAPVYGSGIAMVSWVAQHLRYWSGWLRRAKRHSVTVGAIEHDVLWFQRHMHQVLPECGVTFPKVTAYAHPCPDCGQAFQDVLLTAT